jgi:hypothetical protein
MTILIADVADKKLLFMERWRFWSLIKALKLLLQVITDKNL